MFQRILFPLEKRKRPEILSPAAAEAVCAEALAASFSAIFNVRRSRREILVLACGGARFLEVLFDDAAVKEVNAAIGERGVALVVRHHADR